MYEESAGVPMILVGPGVAAGQVLAEPVSHVDCAVTILQAAGAPALPQASGQSLLDLAQGAAPTRAVLSEYHAIGCTAGATMLRHGRFKYCHYVDHPAQLFDLQADPEELQDLAGQPAHLADLQACEQALRALLDPDAVNKRAKKRQHELLAGQGGREAALARGDLGFTPAPGTEAAFN